MFSNHIKLILLVYYTLIIAASLGSPIVRELKDENWAEICSGEWMVEFAAHWCKNCKAFQYELEKLVYPASKLGIKVAKVDVLKATYLSDKFAIRRVPTVFHIRDGEVRLYTGKMKAKSMNNFLKTRAWRNIEPLSLWNNPNLFQMSVRSQFRRIVNSLDQYSSVLRKDFGIPTWGSYIILSTVTFLCSVAFGRLSLGTFNFLKTFLYRKPVSTVVEKVPKLDEKLEELGEDDAPLVEQPEPLVEQQEPLVEQKDFEEKYLSIENESCSGETEDEEEVNTSDIQYRDSGRVRRLMANYMF